MRVGWLALLALLLLAWHFYLERIAYFDLSYYFFNLLYKHTPTIEHRRFVAVLTQVLPLLGLKAGLPAWAALRLYSVSFVLLYVLAFAVCAYWLRNEHVALVVVLLATLLAARTFYYTPSELLQAMAVLLVCYAGLNQQAPLRWRWSTLALVLLIPVVVFGHPLALLPFFFLWGYDWLLNRRYTDWAWYGVLAVGVGSYFWRVALTEPGSYDAQHTIIPTLRTLVAAVNTPSMKAFRELCRGNFLALPLLLLALSTFYCWPGSVVGRAPGAGWRLLYVWLCVLGYVLLVCAVYPDIVVASETYFEEAYFENLLMPLALFVGVPFALELLPLLLAAPRAGRWGRLRLAASVLLVLGLGIRLVHIARTHTNYTAYQNWLAQVLAYTKQFPETKFMLADANVNPAHLRIASWATAYETLERTITLGPDSARTVFITTEVVPFQPYAQQAGLMLSHWESYPQAAFPANYVRLSRQPYRVLNTPLPTDSTALHAYWQAVSQQARLEILTTPANWKPGQRQPVEVRLTGPTGQPLHSGGWQLGGAPILQLTGRFYSGADWSIENVLVKSPLQLDVSRPWTQRIQVESPTIPGKYELEVSLLAPGHPNGLLRQRVPVEIK